MSNRYIGKRALNSGETMPANATSESVILTDGQQAHLVNGEWVISDIEIPEPSAPCEPTIECRLTATEDVIMEILTMI
jgi:hypothetical protein